MLRPMQRHGSSSVTDGPAQMLYCFSQEVLILRGRKSGAVLAGGAWC
jgi:hypothetical protein